jgi:hypothetical protein
VIQDPLGLLLRLALLLHLQQPLPLLLGLLLLQELLLGELLPLRVPLPLFLLLHQCISRMKQHSRINVLHLISPLKNFYPSNMFTLTSLTFPLYLSLSFLL